MSEENVQELKQIYSLINRPQENPETYEKLKTLLNDNSVEFEELIHVPCKTSAEVFLFMGN